MLGRGSLSPASVAGLREQVNTTWQRRNLEQKLSAPAGSLVDSIPLSARKLFYLERSSLLMFLSELLKVMRACLYPGPASQGYLQRLMRWFPKYPSLVEVLVRSVIRVLGSGCVGSAPPPPPGLTPGVETHSCGGTVDAPH